MKIIIFSLMILICTNCIKIKSSEPTFGIEWETNDVFQVKVLAINPSIKNNAMGEKFDYKIYTMTDLEAVFYEANNPGNQEEEEKPLTKNYLYTQIYYQIQLPCLEHTMVCSYGQLKKEYTAKFPLINFELPLEIQKTLGEKANNECLVITYGSFKRVSDQLFVCHQNPKTLYEIQLRLSRKIREEMKKNTEMFVDLVSKDGVSPRKSGILKLDDDKLLFIDSQTKKKEIEMNYSKIIPYPFATSGKEQIKIGKPEDKLQERCIQITHKIGTNDENADQKENKKEIDKILFCVFYEPGDFSKLNIIDENRGKWLAEFYVDKINKKLEPVVYNKSLSKFAKMTDISVDGKILGPIEHEFRQEFLNKRFELKRQMELDGKLDTKLLESQMEAMRDNMISEKCNGIQVCINAIKYKLTHNLLPLNNKDNKLSFSLNNPFNDKMPKENIKIDNVENGKAKQLVEDVSRLKGVNNFFAEPVKVITSSPSKENIRESLKFFKTMRKTIKYTKVSDFIKCSDNKDIGYLLNRRLALIPYMTEHDYLFDYLGIIGSFYQVNSSKDNVIRK